jgi:hypothetical protein
MSRDESVIAILKEACADLLAKGHSIYGAHPRDPRVMVEHAPTGRWYTVRLRTDGNVTRIERLQEIDPPAEHAA